MRREAKEFRIKKSASNIEPKSASMKLPECPLPSTLNAKIEQNNLHPHHAPIIKTYSNVGPAQPFFDFEKFHKDYSSGLTQYPPQVINFFMNNDLNHISKQIFNSMQEAGFTQGQAKKAKVKKAKNKADGVEGKEPTSEIKFRRKVSHSKPNSRQGSKGRYKGERLSTHGSRSSSRNSSGKSESKVKTKSANKVKKLGRHKHSSSQFKIDRRIKLNGQDTDLLYAGNPKSYYRRENSKQRFNKSKYL